MAATERFTVVIDVSLGFQSFLINASPTDALNVGFGATVTGLNGTGSDLDFFQQMQTDTTGVVGVQVGSTIGLTVAQGKKNDAGGAINCDHIRLDFEPNDATTGTITVNVTFKG